MSELFGTDGVRGIPGQYPLIPETLRLTHFGDSSPGTPVNLEVDMMGRYVVEYLKGRLAEGKTEPAVTREHLARHGFAGKEGAR